MDTGMDLITVCICTYKRLRLLEQLLEKLSAQNTQNVFNYSVLVVDNDEGRSAESIVNTSKINSTVNVDYYHEPIQNIALARNKAVLNAIGNYVAFIDDDEYPDNSWLLNLYNACQVYQADGVLGPVKPHFDTEPPNWIVRGRICERKSFKTGTILKYPSDTRTGNVLIRKSLFRNEKDFFSPQFGRTGGEDVDFFRRMIEKGKNFVWCDEAPVFEHIPPERITRKYHIKRALLRGTVAASHELSCTMKAKSLLKSTVASLIYVLSLPFFLVAGQHMFMKYLIRFCDHFGKLSASAGIALVKER